MKYRNIDTDSVWTEKNPECPKAPWIFLYLLFKNFFFKLR